MSADLQVMLCLAIATAIPLALANIGSVRGWANALLGWLIVAVSLVGTLVAILAAYRLVTA